MENEVTKCVLVIAEELPVGLAMNAAAVLAITLGRRVETIIGPNVADGSGEQHEGLVSIPVPILKAGQEQVKAIRSQATANEELLVVDFTETAQAARTYGDYTQEMAARTKEELTYRGVALYGNKKLINKLTGNLPLLR